LEKPFMVLATQNPIEYEGTFPLPEAQLDRFLIRIRLGYPGHDEEIAMLDAQQYRHPLTTLEQVVTVEDLLSAQEAVRAVYIAPEVKRYIVDIITGTRRHANVYLGASPRGSLALYRTAQARAAMVGRDYVLPDDVKALAEPTLAHRLLMGPNARIQKVSGSQVVREILDSLRVPGATIGAR
jgi:MoxR-like ATPase